MNRATAFALAACALNCGPVLGNGFYIPVQAPEATARGNAWLATADTAAAVYYNAAGLTQLGSIEAEIGGYSILLGLKADTDLGNHYRANDSWAYIPQIYAGIPISDKLVAGFGVNTPFGLATDWRNTQFRQIAVDTELTYVTGWAVLGYELTDTLSIGGGIGVHHADALLRQGLSFGGINDFSEFSGDDDALTWTVSALWKPTEQHSFGVVYRSKADFDLDGYAEVIGGPGEDAKLDFITPATLGAGYAFTPCKEWSFEANIEWVNWDELNSLNLKSDTGAFDNTIAFNWHSNFIYSIGGTRFFDSGWQVSAGYNFIENSQPDETFNPGISDANRHWLNVGVGRDYGRFNWDLAYQYAFSDRDVSGSPGGLADGTFKSRFHGIMLNAGWKF